MNKHTPGPWRTVELGSEGISIKPDTGNLRADISTVARLGLNRADARLIAAAPELLTALETCYEQAKLFNRDTDTCWVVIRDMCEAAIRKARGEQ